MQDSSIYVLYLTFCKATHSVAIYDAIIVNLIGNYNFWDVRILQMIIYDTITTYKTMISAGIADNTEI